ncbi:HNH endonuclease [Vibrio vulnificus]|uniref:HNH endonuclease signature motif containing protein n=1 Tax=Vibrio vulnificus TaxID=672 RepID=UPI0024144AC3|nr:HNH endonuclease signature motif containing protein [Vibrio vulnificus]
MFQFDSGVVVRCSRTHLVMTASGKPYLEVHHLIRLIDDGPDTPLNCVAVCPNCHRELHYSSEQRALTEKLKEIALEKESG